VCKTAPRPSQWAVGRRCGSRDSLGSDGRSGSITGVKRRIPEAALRLRERGGREREKSVVVARKRLSSGMPMNSPPKRALAELLAREGALKFAFTSSLLRCRGDDVSSVLLGIAGWLGDGEQARFKQRGSRASSVFLADT
jgi:hypothetical protein